MSQQSLIPDAIYRFNRNKNLRYYRACRTKSGIDFLYPISVDGSKIVDQHESGRQYVILYLVTKWGKLAAGGYWLNPKKAFKQVYVTDATIDDLAFVANRMEDLPAADRVLDDVLNRDDIQLDMEVWGSLLE